MCVGLISGGGITSLHFIDFFLQLILTESQWTILIVLLRFLFYKASNFAKYKLKFPQSIFLAKFQSMIIKISFCISRLNIQKSSWIKKTQSWAQNDHTRSSKGSRARVGLSISILSFLYCVRLVEGFEKIILYTQQQWHCRERASCGKKEENLKIRDARTQSDSVCNLKAKCSEVSRSDKIYFCSTDNISIKTA